MQDRNFNTEKTFVNNETQTNSLELDNKPLLEKWIIDEEDKNVSIIDQVTEAAESAMLETGYVYEKTTGLYYHCKSGYYYDTVSINFPFLL